MWLFVMFDLPTNTHQERKHASLFRKELLLDGFNMMQYSVYTRVCPSKEHAQVHIKRIRECTPTDGKVSVLQVTDYQFGNMEHIINGEKTRLHDGFHFQQIKIF